MGNYSRTQAEAVISDALLALQAEPSLVDCTTADALSCVVIEAATALSSLPERDQAITLNALRNTTDAILKAAARRV